MAECECDNVTNYDGQHKCIRCGKRFIPMADIEHAGEQIPAKERAFREGLKNAGSWTIDKWISNYALSGKYNPDR